VQLPRAGAVSLCRPGTTATLDISAPSSSATAAACGSLANASFCAARQEKPTERKPAGLIAIVLRRTALLRPY